MAYTMQKTAAPKPKPAPTPPAAGFEGKPLYEGTDIYNAPIYDPNSASFDPTGWAPIYAPPPARATSVPGLSPGDWVQPYDPGSGAPNPYVPSSSQGPSGPDPSYLAAQAAALEAQAALHSSIRAARGRALIDFGAPDLAGMAGLDVDPTTADFARQNYASGNATLARINKAHQDRQRAVVNTLAGRGILNSGELGYQSGQESQQYGSAQYDAWKQLMDYMGNLTQQDVGQSRKTRDALLDALQGAYTTRLQQGF